MSDRLRTWFGHRHQCQDAGNTSVDYTLLVAGAAAVLSVALFAIGPLIHGI